MKLQFYNDKIDNYTKVLLNQFLICFEELNKNYTEENRIKTILLGKMLYDKISSLSKENKEDIDLRIYLFTILNINLKSILALDEIKGKRK